MSNIYIQEPPTNGKVLLHTTVGDIDIELWSKETPKACRNFVQLCLEEYYNGTIFHRVVKGFIVQGGDPSGDGTGGESIYGYPFKDEFHSRLRFVRRGLVAMANSGKDDNGSQFFFSLGAAPELQNKHTIFGKVTGDTLYNMLKLEEGLVDHDDRPIYPHKIISTKVLLNPFPDIQPRIVTKALDVVPKRPKEKVQKNFKLLSFGEEAEEDEAEMEVVNEPYKGRSKSSHDLANDPTLSSVPAVVLDEEKMFDRAADPAAVDSVRKKLDKASADKTGLTKEMEISMKELVQDPYNNTKEEPEESEKSKSDEKRKEIQRQIKELKRELKKKRQNEIEKKEEEVVEEEPVKDENSVLSEYHKQLQKYKTKVKSNPSKGTAEREQLTLQFLEKFRNTIESAKNSQTVDNSKSENEEEEDDNEGWLVHCFRADDQKVTVAKDANLPSADRYDISDPRNPITERRRKEKKRKQ